MKLMFRVLKILWTYYTLKRWMHVPNQNTDWLYFHWSPVSSAFHKKLFSSIIGTTFWQCV